MTFSVKFTNDFESPKLSYNWTVSAGRIIEGGNGATIKIATNPESGSAVVEVKVKIGGLPAACASEFTRKADVLAVTTALCGCYDEYYSLPLKHEFARIDMFIVRLLDNPDAEAHIISTIRKNETVKKGKNHLKKLMKHIELRDFDKSRLMFGIEKSDFNSRRTRLIAVPKDVPPECNDCEIIKGENFR